MRLDHVHMVVRDRPAMLAWLDKVLGLRPSPDFSLWSDMPGGPVITVTPDGGLALAVFEESEAKPASHCSDHTVAFAVTAERFMELAGHARALGLTPPPGMPAKDIAPKDLGLAVSIFVEGPEGTRFEITCYDLDTVRRWLEGA